ncbi:hypothetical protein [Arsenophonus sp.]|uniref:hypothetical protein n=1 Tax=Arsenophonus sp. TaxID=1872640 RepID=UPI0028564969|nr:hypothetical protein [Arsenophonus sp.]MDR5616924.1 hypothetical protein [Arsenophonus sp.]MDR5618111.1 hypothetical protein [Arsenophonus sp.]MDR5618286.1 hypothetical protein [Arsenophonus sp.]
MKYSTEIPRAEIDENGFAKNRGWIKTYMSRNEPPYEYFGATMELLYKGVSVGQYSYIDAPEIPDNDDIGMFGVMTVKNGYILLITEARQHLIPTIRLPVPLITSAR